MSAFWMTYIDLVELLLNVLRALREGDWNLHLDSMNKMIPWCFSTKKGAVAKYYVSTDYGASCVGHLRQMVQTSSNGSKHPDLSISRIKRDEGDVHSILEMLTTTWIYPFVKPGQDLCSLSTGASPPDEVVNDHLNAEEIGREAWEIFQAKRLSEKRSMKFFDVLPRLK